MAKSIDKLFSLIFESYDNGAFIVPRANIATELNDEQLLEIGNKVYDEYEIDKLSRKDWEVRLEEIFKLAEQISYEKRHSETPRSNIKYPILATAALSFSARAYPNIVKGSNVVKHQVVGNDIGGIKASRGERVTHHMNYQIIEQMNGWEDEMDQLLINLALVGTAFKKTYYDPVDNINVSELVFANDLVVNYNVKSIDTARRITHVIELHPNDIIERIRSDTFLDFDLDATNAGRKDQDNPSDDQNDPDLPHTFLEQHRWLDLDDDGYQEPYIVTVHRDSKKVVRIVPRFDFNTIQLNNDSEIIRIVADQYFTQFTFLPAFDGNFYRMGFGALLYAPVNIINTIFNQLLDAGTLANRQGGFLGQGIKLKPGMGHGTLTFQQAEWKQISFMGDDIRRQIFALPLKEPSPVLFQLLGLMLEATKELASQADVLTGEHPKGNVPATTTLALIEQGLKIFTAIYKRVYRSLKSEFKKLRKLNYLYLSAEEYNNIIDYSKQVQDPQTGQVVLQQVIIDPKEDYSDMWMDIIPVSGAADVSDTQRIIKAQALLEMRGQGLNDDAINKRYLEALQIPDVSELLPPENAQPPPDPKIVIEEKKLELKMIELEIEARRQIAEEREQAGKIMKYWADSVNALSDAETKEMGALTEVYKNELKFISDNQKAYMSLIGQLNNTAEERKMKKNDKGTV